jgi:hypothetical protein
LNTKKGNLKQWQELGELTKEVYDKVVDLCMKADQIMPKKDWQYASKAQRAIGVFRSDAEEVMFRQLGMAGGARIDIFYARESRSYKVS